MPRVVAPFTIDTWDYWMMMCEVEEGYVLPFHSFHDIRGSVVVAVAVIFPV